MVNLSLLLLLNLLPSVLLSNYLSLELNEFPNLNEQYIINNTIEYIFNVNTSDCTNTLRVNAYSSDASRDYPLRIVVRQQKAVLSWQVPLLVGTTYGDLQFSNTSRTLCPDGMNQLDSVTITNIICPVVSISVSTSSPNNITFELDAEPERDFYLRHLQSYDTFVSPSRPKIYYYQFNDTIDSVLVTIQSDDDVCMIFSVQNSSCPVYDLERDVRFDGYWETVSKKGGMIVSRSRFPNGFFLIFVSKAEDYDCSGHHTSGVINRNKHVRFVVRSNISYAEYVRAVAATVCCIVFFCLSFWTLLCVCLCRRGVRRPMTMESVDEPSEPLATPTSVVSGLGDINNDSSMDETEYDTITEVDLVSQIIRSKGVLFVIDLARKDPRVLKRKSYLYLWHVMTVAVFYGLPVVQLVLTYQRMLENTGNQDLCYYNFLCAHPLGVLNDFNHLFSNIGYVVLGVLFLLLVYRRERMHEDQTFDRHYGIPQHYGLFYAMGFALIMEGVLSGSYHICPNHTNFQFDSSFMYVMAVLIMVKLYQNRHPDINATAYATFGVLAGAICLGMIGILDGTIYFWISFTVIHLATCLLLTVQIYYMGCWKLDRGVIIRVFRTLSNDFRSGPINVLRPVYKGRMILLFLANVCNWILAVFGLYHHERDFASYLLAIFMANTLLYTLFYIVMKLCHCERMEPQAILFVLLSTLAWFTSMYFFLHKSIQWSLTPSESRRFNKPCQLLEFYDSHDIWHFLSATAMFFSFMLLLTLDDDLSHTHRSKIHVF